jgi:uncharacterized membrane protein YoaK (UPF0700 family)
MNDRQRRGSGEDREPAGEPRVPGSATLAIGILLAACAGSADTLAFFGLGNAFGGIVTGNLVSAGFGLAAGDAALVKPTLVAVAGCVAGELAWARLLRRPAAAVPLLITELALFALVLTGWLAAGSRPAGNSALVLLALVSVALGGQSIWALRIHQTTTYFTGMLTTAINAAASRSPASTSLGTSTRQLTALLAGAILGGTALRFLRSAAPVIPLVFLAVTVAIHISARPEAKRPAPAGRPRLRPGAGPGG